MSAKKQAEKRYPRKVKRVTTVMSQGSLTATPKSKISRTRNNNWARSNNNKQQFNKNTNNCRLVASARLLLCVFLVRFLLHSDVAYNSLLKEVPTDLWVTAMSQGYESENLLWVRAMSPPQILWGSWRWMFWFRENDVSGIFRNVFGRFCHI